jgi:hypothetical protein
MAIIGLVNSGRKNRVHKNPRSTPPPAHTRCVPVNAPINACVVDTGNPAMVAIITVTAVLAAMMTRSSVASDGEAVEVPMLEKRVMSFRAIKIEAIDPRNVMPVAQQIAVR